MNILRKKLQTEEQEHKFNINQVQSQCITMEELEEINKTVIALAEKQMKKRSIMCLERISLIHSHQVAKYTQYIQGLEQEN